LEPSCLLETRELGRNFEGFAALRNVDFRLPKGEIHAIIGPNGAGKTTFFRVVSGELRPSSGRIFYRSGDITGLSPWQICRLGIGRAYQVTNVFPQLTVYENIRIPVQAMQVVYNFWSTIASYKTFHEKAMDIIREIGLEPRRSEVAKNLSHGEKRHLEIGLALASDPELLLLDEPTAGMSLKETMHSVGLIQKITAERNLTVLIIEHKMDVVNAIANRITVFHQGSILATGRPDDIRNDEKVKSVYFRGR
jgi:branched-chain amino acid transport system ATP-binding protein